MYYPQDVTKDMGPTSVMPGSQYHFMPNTEDRRRGALPAGRIVCFKEFFYFLIFLMI
jgi:ectoine hydroxylase-related dioxygenase (phytanoyl-CoA dioxygenase family)